ncbi:hypothetical protein R7E47_20380 [Vibrio sp. Vb1026]|uniref:hypothetical protein n=1 Tax=Vibrio TaxID=662 RepID=UPI002964EC2C|nr:hypothetical protein [Vibrio sp. Vb1026]EME9804119.1 hypothetical protein [Vibrio alginolyticus]MDW1877299.1 hypothetical protein [Vibrio sp. Vb1026]MDW1877304.1 hypothetical protein [Vibrio sp. Vb1026]
MSTSSKDITFRPTLDQYVAYAEQPDVQRMFAVAAALELIKADVSTARERNTTSLERHVSNLSEYADTIQAALNVKSSS